LQYLSSTKPGTIGQLKKVTVTVAVATLIICVKLFSCTEAMWGGVDHTMVHPTFYLCGPQCNWSQQ